MRHRLPVGATLARVGRDLRDQSQQDIPEVENVGRWVDAARVAAAAADEQLRRLVAVGRCYPEEHAVDRSVIFTVEDRAVTESFRHSSP